MKFRIISSGSKGNAILYDFVLVDCSVAYSRLPVNEIKLVLLTHIHSDHFNLKSIKKLYDNGIPIAWCEWLQRPLEDVGIKPYILELNQWVSFGSVQVAPFNLYHDVPNCGYRIKIGKEKAFHATDTSTLEGISAIGYNIYAIENSYDEVSIYDVIDNKIKNQEFAYEINAIKRHLSFQQAQRFIEENAIEPYEYHKLHISERYKGD